jgi:hypothetical protein
MEQQPHRLRQQGGGFGHLALMHRWWCLPPMLIREYEIHSQGVHDEQNRPIKGRSGVGLIKKRRYVIMGAPMRKFDSGCEESGREYV